MNLRMSHKVLPASSHNIRSSKILLTIGSIFLIFALAVPNLYGSGQDQNNDTAPPDGLANIINTDQAGWNVPTNQIIVKYRDQDPEIRINPASTAEVSRLSAAAGVALTYAREMSGDAHVLRLPSRMDAMAVKRITAQIAALPEVAYAEADQIMQHTATPNDPRYPEQWHYFVPTSSNYGINLPPAWDLIGGLSSVVVAVIDTGITNHVEFSGKTVPGYDFISYALDANDGDGRDGDPSDPGDWITAAESASGYFAGCPVSDSSWHGTHVAGTISAASNNGTGVAGIDWNAKILPVRVLGKCGGYTSDIVDGMRWAAGLPVTGVPANANPAKVLNLSLGGTGACSTTEQDAITAINATGATVVVAAGNSNQNASNFSPASCNGVIAVSATNRAGNKAYYSNYGSIVAISAPGGDAIEGYGILSTLNTGTQGPVADTYALYQGTSMAAPHVSGVASLLYSADSTLQWNQILQTMQDTVTPFPAGSTCTTSICGSGIVNAFSALQSVMATEAPAAPTGVAATNGTYSNKVRVSWTASSGATSYKVYRNTSGSSPVEENLIASPSGSPYDDFSAVFGQVYYYWVKACNSVGCSTYSSSAMGQLGEAGSVEIFLPLILHDGGSSPPSSGIVNGDFEQGRVGWTEYSSNGDDLIFQDTQYGIPHSGEWFAWLGYYNNEISRLSQNVTIPASQPYLHFWIWIDSEDFCGYDYAYIKVNGTYLAYRDLCSSANTYGWVKSVWNLSSYAGQTVNLMFEVETDGSLYSNFFLDDVSLSSSASGATFNFIPRGSPMDVKPDKPEFDTSK